MVPSRFYSTVISCFSNALRIAMDPSRLLPMIVLGEGAMAVIAVAGARWAAIPVVAGRIVVGLFAGLAAALVLAAINLSFLRRGGSAWPGTSLRLVCRVVVRPLFDQVHVGHIVVISALAGLGEELLFRGLLQPLLGLFVASAVFGAVHVAGRQFVGYGIWAACIGAFLGWLMSITGGLLAPIVAHALYDALALAYVRFGPKDVCGGE
jgi:uncharacterized protein